MCSQLALAGDERAVRRDDDRMQEADCGDAGCEPADVAEFAAVTVTNNNVLDLQSAILRARRLYLDNTRDDGTIAGLVQMVFEGHRLAFGEAIFVDYTLWFRTAGIVGFDGFGARPRHFRKISE